MNSPNDLSWLPESQVLKVCGLSRSTLQSWKRSGLDLDVDAAYDLTALVALVVLAATREFLSPKEMVSAWRSLSRAGKDKYIVDAARLLEEGGRFDLVIDVTYGSLEIVLDDAELAKAVGRLHRPRPVVVIDMAEEIFRAAKYFEDHANPTSRPETKGPGRPRSADRLRIVGEGGG
jgi:hypothetical protein